MAEGLVLLSVLTVEIEVTYHDRVKGERTANTKSPQLLFISQALTPHNLAATQCGKASHKICMSLIQWRKHRRIPPLEIPV